MKSLKLIIENYEFEVPVFNHEGSNWVALKPLCEALGVAYSVQHRKVVSSEFVRYHHMVTPSNGGNQNTLCIEIDSVGEWIFGINPNKVNPEIKERMYLFRQKLQAVLYAAVTGHSDVNQVASLVEEVKKLSQLVAILFEKNQVLEEIVMKSQRADASIAGYQLSQYRKSIRGPQVA